MVLSSRSRRMLTRSSLHEGEAWLRWQAICAGFSAFVHTKISRVIGATSIHVGTMCFGQNIAFMLQDK
jgi:hypothetical protein